MGNVESLDLFLPEVFLTSAALLLLVVDLATRRSPRRVQVLTGVALAALAVVAAANAALPATSTPLFGGFLQHDALRTFFDWIFWGAAVLTVIIAPRSAQISSERLGEFLALLFALLLGLHLMASATDLLLIYLGIETVSLASYVLTGFRTGDRKANEAALKYVIYGGVASGIMLYGMSILYGLYGTTHLLGAGGIAAQVQATQIVHGAGIQGAQLALVVAVVFVLAGVGYKIASVPFHMWCPDVYEGAPTPFTAFLSVGPKAAGFAVAIRFFFGTFGSGAGAEFTLRSDLPWPAILGILSALTMTLGNVTALVQTNLKRMLAYSSIAHAGYLLMGLAAASSAGVQSVLVYLVIYVFMNVGAFLALMAVARTAGGEELSHFRGLSARAPVAALTFAVFLFSLTGIPPLAGFTGKYLLFAALLQGGGFWNALLALIGVVNSALSLVYYARVVKAMYLEEGADRRPLPVPGIYTGVLVGLAALVLLFGVAWSPLVKWAAHAFGAAA